MVSRFLNFIGYTPTDKNSAIHSFPIFSQKDCPKPQLQAMNGNCPSLLQSMKNNSASPLTIWERFSSLASLFWNCLKNIFSCCSAASVENTSQDLRADLLLNGRDIIIQQLGQLPPVPNSSFKSALIVKLDDQIIGYHLGPIAENNPSSIATFQNQAILKMNQALNGKTISPKSELSIETFFIEKLDPRNFALYSKMDKVKPSLNDGSGEWGGGVTSRLMNLGAINYLAKHFSGSQNDPTFKDPQHNPITNYLLAEFRKN